MGMKACWSWRASSGTLYRVSLGIFFLSFLFPFEFLVAVAEDLTIQLPSATRGDEMEASPVSISAFMHCLLPPGRGGMAWTGALSKMGEAGLELSLFQFHHLWWNLSYFIPVKCVLVGVVH